MSYPNADPELRHWLDTNTYHHKDFPISELASIVKETNVKITVIIPAKEVAKHIGGVLKRTVKPLVDAHVVTNVIAIDANSADKTGNVAAANGATVLQRAEIAPELGPSLGKGDAMWRALLNISSSRGRDGCSDNDIVAFLDGDTSDPDPSHLIGIIGPLIHKDKLQMVRGCFDRPFRSANGDIQPHQGGRVTEILARPLLNGHFPELAGFRQPLAGEFAARRGLLKDLKFPVGYGVEIGTLIDASRLVGMAPLAECDLGTRQSKWWFPLTVETSETLLTSSRDDHKDLRQLGSMALTILNAVERRLNHPGALGQALNDKMWLPWDGNYQIVSAAERPSVNEYLRAKRKPLIEPPFIDVPEILNFRDIGGYPTTQNFFVRRGLIFRSANFDDLTAMGVRRLQSLRIKAVFDLRSAHEVEKSKATGGDKEFNAWSAQEYGPKRYHVPVFAESDHSPEAMAKRFKDYSAEGTEVSHLEVLSSYCTDLLTGLCEILSSNSSQFSDCSTCNPFASRHLLVPAVTNFDPLHSRERPDRGACHDSLVTRRLLKVYSWRGIRVH